jgi:hypothetical protein
LANWEVGLANSGQAAEVVRLADWELAKVVALANWEVGLADLEQVGVGLANFKVGSADSEQADGPPLLLVGAWSPSMMW